MVARVRIPYRVLNINNMKKIILLLIIVFSMSGCYVGFRTPYYKNYNPHGNRYRTPYYQSHPNRQHRIVPGKIYKPYFRPGRY